MKLLHLFSALLIAVIPASGADEKKPPAKKPEPAKKADPLKTPDAKKPDAKPAPRGRTDMLDEEVVALLKPYDKNDDYQIDVIEFGAVETDFKKKPFGPLKQFDKAKDGKLDAMIDRAYMNVKLGSAAPKKAPVKKPEAPKPAAKPAPAPAPAAPASPPAPETKKPG